MEILGVKNAVRNYFTNPNKEALFIFGFQKSGTSAIAGLLAARVGKSVTIDTKYLWYPYNQMLSKGEISIEYLVNKYSYPFSKDIIKEPEATFFIDKIQECFYLNKYIFIVRNPFDAIRSILNRLKLRGDKEKIELKNIDPNWRYIFEKKNEKNYIKILADRWVLANNQIQKIEGEYCILVRYEDFNSNKEKYIDKIVDRLGLKKQNDISHLVNHQFQPKGDYNVDVRNFFGEKNYRIINNTCERLNKYFGY